jgi:hypothetical protein
MHQNVGDTDRYIRIALGTLILGLGIGHRKMWGLVGLALILTGLCRRCCLYLPFGIDTRSCCSRRIPVTRIE